MKLIFKGIYNSDPESLPRDEHRKGAVMFKEAENYNIFSLLASLVSILLLFILGIVGFLRGGINLFMGFGQGALLSFLSMIPHELLHAIVFRETVYMYLAPKQFGAFVIGLEDMSKGRFILMSIMPNLIFGFIPFIIYMINPELHVLGVFSIFSISMGVGDYYNIINALTQMPANAKTYLHGFNSYWYIPEE